MLERNMRRRLSSELHGESGSKAPRLYEDYLLNTSLEVIMSLCFLGLLMGYGPPAYLAYGLAGIGAVCFLIRMIFLVNHPENIKKPPRWSIHPKLLILLSYGFLFYIRDQFGWMWGVLAIMVVFAGVKLILPLLIRVKMLP